MSPARRSFLLALPAGLAVLLAAHPPDPSEGEVLGDLAGNETRWLVVHVGLLLALPLLAVWMWLVLEGVDGRAASVSRGALVFFVAFYTAFDALVGITTGVLAREARALGADGPAGQLVEVWWGIPAPVWVFSTLGPLSWLVAAAAAAAAHLRARSGPFVVGGLAVAAPLFAFGHPTLAGPLGMLALMVAAAALQRRHAATVGRP